VSNFIVRGLLLAGIFLSLACLPGCHGSPITITLSCPNCTGTPNASVSINQGDTVGITASVANDKTNSGVSWTLGSSVGSLSSQTTTSVTYVAPTALTATTTAVVTATSIANTNVTETVTITINAVFEFQTTSLPIATKGLAYVATINTIGAAGPFTWTITSGVLPAGLTLASSNTASVNITGTPTTVGSSTLTLQATNGSGTPISQSFTITVNPPPSLTITTPLTIAPGTIGQFYTYTLQAAYGTPPYSWSIIAGTLPSGLTCAGAALPCSLSDGVISGTPTTVGTFPFTVQVEDSATPNRGIATATLTLTVTEVLVNSDLNGNYAFLVSGFDASFKHFMAAGSFLATGGAISGGIMDTNDGGTVQTQIAFSGTYSIGANGVGTLTFAPVGRTFAVSFVPSASGTFVQNANLIEFDNTGVQASGVLLQQTTTDFSTALTSGGYAFGFLGGDSTGLRYGLAGAFTASAGSFSNGVLDSDDGGTLQTETAFTVAAFNSPNLSTGRGTMAFSVAGTAANYAFYVVNLSQVLVIEIDSAAIVSGNVLLQAGPFGASSLTDGVFATTALPAAGTALSQLGVITTDGSSTLSTSFNNNTSVTGAIQTGSGSYIVATANGRTTLTGSTGLASSNPVLYLVQANQGFLVGTDAAVTFGFLKAQSGSLTLSGTYAGGSLPPTLSAPTMEAQSLGEVDAASATSGVLTITYYAVNITGLLANQSGILGYSTPSTNGRGTIPASGNPTYIFYVLSPSEFWSLSVNPNGMIKTFPPACVPSCGVQ
jgi:hypothetical protein